MGSHLSDPTQTLIECIGCATIEIKKKQRSPKYKPLKTLKE